MKFKKLINSTIMKLFMAQKEPDLVIILFIILLFSLIMKAKILMG